MINNKALECLQSGGVGIISHNTRTDVETGYMTGQLKRVKLSQTTYVDITCLCQDLDWINDVIDDAFTAVFGWILTETETEINTEGELMVTLHFEDMGPNQQYEWTEL